jgi:hypothetical protein
LPARAGTAKLEVMKMILALFAFCSSLCAVSVVSASAPSKPVLLVMTSHDKLGDTGKPTGFFLGELTHPLEVFEAEHEGIRRIADVQVVPLEMTFEQHDETIIHRAVCEVVHEQVQTHAR